MRAQRLDAEAAISFLLDYAVNADDDWGYGYLVGAAYERPDIALRVALTYNSKISYDLDTDRVLDSSPRRHPRRHDDDVDTPQSVQLDFQTGVAPKTLVFGYDPLGGLVGVRHQPAGLYGQITAARSSASARPLIDYADDWWTYNIGIGAAAHRRARRARSRSPTSRTSAA